MKALLPGLHAPEPVVNPALLPEAPLPGAPFRARRQRRGNMANQAGRAAEEIVLRQYQNTGAHLLAERWRCAEGELDLVVLKDDVLIFVEVKQRKCLNGWDSPVSANQWRRLEAAASQYIVQYLADTGIQPVCRFDVALVNHDGAVQIIENAWSCLM